MMATGRTVVSREVVHGPGLLWLSLVLCPGYMVLNWDDRTAVLADFRTCRQIAPVDRIPGIAVVSLAMVTGEFSTFAYAGVL
ncbi:MAG: hypothetical protein NTW33_10790 [Methanoregula sp.]|jgi:hypothetical protein|nr:hypothetical protein [Methanoregula sp.]